MLNRIETGQRWSVPSLMYQNPPFSCSLDTIYRIDGMGRAIL